MNAGQVEDDRVTGTSADPYRLRAVVLKRMIEYIYILLKRAEISPGGSEGGIGSTFGDCPDTFFT